MARHAPTNTLILLGTLRTGYLQKAQSKYFEAFAFNPTARHILPMPMIIRTYREADEEQVIELWHLCNLLVPWNDAQQEIQMKLKVQPELFLVGTVGEYVVATAMAGYDGHRGWPYSLAVAPDRQ